jgi:hypothetical protein
MRRTGNFLEPLCETAVDLAPVQLIYARYDTHFRMPDAEFQPDDCAPEGRKRSTSLLPQSQYSLRVALLANRV